MCKVAHLQEGAFMRGYCLYADHRGNDVVCVCEVSCTAQFLTVKFCGIYEI